METKEQIFYVVTQIFKDRFPLGKKIFLPNILKILHRFDSDVRLLLYSFVIQGP
jgi:hypothetical protein